MATKNESDIGTFKPKCGKLIYPPGGYLYGSPCGKTATYEHEGASYCKTHHPPTVEAKRTAKQAERNARFSASMAASKAVVDEFAAMRKDAARYLKLRDRTATRLRVWLPNENDAGATGPFDLQHLDAALDAE